MEAWEETQLLVDDLRDDYNCEPLVYFSGSKGFHVIVPRYIRHERCHEIAWMIVKEHPITVDDSVYRTRSMWRCNNTWNRKGRRQKRLVDPSWSLTQVLKYSQGIHMPRTHTEDLDITEYVDQLPERGSYERVHDTDFRSGMYPCMRRLWEMDSPPEGQRNHFLYIMARHCYRSGLDINDAMSLFASHHLYGDFRNNEYERVVKSVYRTGKSGIGCKTGRDANVLQPQCHGICPWRNEWSVRDVFKT